MTSKTAEAPVADLNAILALLQDVKAGQDRTQARLDALETQVEKQAASVPTITPTEAYAPWESDSPNEVMARLGSNGEVVGSLRSTPKDANGRTLSDFALQMHPPTYQLGQPIRINPESTSNGDFPKGVTWADRLARYRSDGVGTITKIEYQGRDGQWRYMIKVAKVGGLNGFLRVADSELLPA